MKLFRRYSDEGWGSGWTFRWGWLPGRLVTLRRSLAHASHVVASAPARLIAWLAIGTRSHDICFLACAPLLAVVLIGLFGGGV